MYARVLRRCLSRPPHVYNGGHPKVAQAAAMSRGLLLQFHTSERLLRHAADQKDGGDRRHDPEHDDRARYLDAALQRLPADRPRCHVDSLCGMQWERS